jgi:hypothetical protein
MECFCRMRDAGRHLHQDLAPPDWESPAGGDVVRKPRLSRGAYVYRGGGDVHWLAQPCDVLTSGSPSTEEIVVVFACGCRASVPRDSLGRAPR